LTARDFFYQPGGRLHPWWRLLAFVLITAVSVVVLGWMVFAIVPGSMPADHTGTLNVRQFTLSAVVFSAALLIGHAVMLRWIDRLPWSYAGLGADQATPGRLGVGFALGALAIGVPSLLLLGVDWLAPHHATAGSWLLFALRVALLLLPAALYEELMMRGYVFAVLRDAWGWKSALVVTSVAFGLLHLGNPGADVQSVVAVIIAGVFLGGILVATGSLYAAWMAHFAWNWVMAALLHTAVSGLPLAAPDYRVVDAGPDWATGGQWGPEGGAGAVAGMLVGLLYLYARWQRRATALRADTVRDSHLNDTMDHLHG
jgi:membrane protease YdiL (CAAX protease family)